MAAIAAVAAALRVSVVGRLAGGEFGATLVLDSSGRQLVLKVVGDARLAATWATGAEMATRLRASGYPAPEYYGVGVVDGASWSLQQRLRGAVPDVLSAALAGRLLALAASHQDAAGRAADWLAPSLVSHRSLAGKLAARDSTARLGRELSHVLNRQVPPGIRSGDVQHDDFHHRNLLADGDRITGVFDWEGAGPGDWRFDVVTLAFWSVIVGEQFDPSAAEMIQSRMLAEVPADILALFSARISISVLDFYDRVRPAVVQSVAAGIETSISPWWGHASGTGIA